MANKKKNSTQSTLFDLPTVRREATDRTVVHKEEMNITNLGLVSLSEGRSQVYKDFSHYIKSQK